MSVILLVKIYFDSRSQRKLFRSTNFISLRGNIICIFWLSHETNVTPNVKILNYTVWKYSVSSWLYSFLLSDKNKEVATLIY